jgi:hypothetical protein
MLLVTPDGSTVHRTLQLVDFSRAAPIYESLQDALEALGYAEGGEPE